MLDEVAELEDGLVVGVVLQVHGPHRIRLLVLLVPHQQEKLNGRRPTSWLSSFNCAESLPAGLPMGGSSTGWLFLQNMENEIK